MYKKFEALEKEKQKKIINGVMEEFVKGGYDKASINNIVAKLNISKGSIFFYFGNKKQMYLYMYDYCRKITEDYLEENVDYNNPDLLIRFGQMMKHNIMILDEHPLVFAFIKNAKQEKSEDVCGEIKERKSKASEEIFRRVYENIDYNLFKDEIDHEKAVYTIKVTLREIVHMVFIGKMENAKNTMKKIEEYIEFFRGVFYR